MRMNKSLRYREYQSSLYHYPNNREKKGDKTMKLTKDDLTLIESVFEELTKMNYNTLNTFLGSRTILEVQELYLRLRYADYMERNHIARLEDMTSDDFVEFAMEREHERRLSSEEW